MKNYYIPKYGEFRCIAGACPDSCCAGWEIVLDDASVERYRTVSGGLGERIRQAMAEDADGDVIFAAQDGKCPFWNAEKLCDIHATLGEQALCDTCRKFPRITQDYGDFMEYDLSMECPEAARMLLTLPPEKLQLRWEEHPELAGDMPEYDADRMQQLFEQREMLFQLMRDTRHPALAQLSSCLKLACEWENIPLSECSATDSGAAIFAFLQSCEILTADWHRILEQSAAAQDKLGVISEALDCEIRAFAFDFFYRQYLRAVFADSAILPVQQAAFSVCAVVSICCRLHLITQEQRLRIWQLFLKEIESDSDNVAELEWCLETEEAFSPAALCAYLEKLRDA